ncbi:GyrI-like domain-containing protein [Methylocella sp.]|uniref:GyrI-like domain-containing protein n=1 Tax=Methylocella sp. TaxID=1978226 RepID=UPI003784871D
MCGRVQRFLALSLVAAAALFAGPHFAPTTALAAAQGEPAAPAPPAASSPPAALPAEPASPDADATAPGVAADAAVETVDVPPRPVALIAGDAKWAEGFHAIRGAIETVKAAIAAAGLKQAGPPFAAFLSTDDESFHFEAMVPLAVKPEGVSDLKDGVKLGSSPYGRAIKFMHRGAYDDIDSTYDLITAYLDEKGLDSRNLFIEEYLTPTTDPDDAALEADIYVFLK